ncbi:hypothetical protein Slit_0600 [Sideroxydans lithotrophicus ES-1]|uniref:Uncharacterized protein n=1 Tax=Sideroxydans lithotrophicus (strain ES-1) TaxID=580332 RepID=D5CN04_SIDLE|nr:hypothetical protein Slit_0600 [Sideroxydans lithotrophicus ES-1]
MPNIFALDVLHTDSRQVVIPMVLKNFARSLCYRLCFGLLCGSFSGHLPATNLVKIKCTLDGPIA